jgi:hypothetical protein
MGLHVRSRLGDARVTRMSFRRLWVFVTNGKIVDFSLLRARRLLALRGYLAICRRLGNGAGYGVEDQGVGQKAHGRQFGVGVNGYD